MLLTYSGDLSQLMCIRGNGPLGRSYQLMGVSGENEYLGMSYQLTSVSEENGSLVKYQLCEYQKKMDMVV